jgi:DNA-binding NtrC family response regulator
LRERVDDIPLLAAHFLQHKGNSRSGAPFRITRPAMDALCAHDWPGNVRELENAIERAVTLCEGDTVRTRDLPPSLLKKLNLSTFSDDDALETAQLPNIPESATHAIHPGTENKSSNGAEISPANGNSSDTLQPLKNFIRDQEARHLNRALHQCGGDKEKAALLLGVSLATLYRKLAGDDRES